MFLFPKACVMCNCFCPLAHQSDWYFSSFPLVALGPSQISVALIKLKSPSGQWSSGHFQYELNKNCMFTLQEANARVVNMIIIIFFSNLMTFLYFRHLLSDLAFSFVSKCRCSTPPPCATGFVEVVAHGDQHLMTMTQKNLQTFSFVHFGHCSWQF